MLALEREGVCHSNMVNPGFVMLPWEGSIFGHSKMVILGARKGQVSLKEKLREAARSYQEAAGRYRSRLP